MTKLPAAIQREVERAEAIEAQMRQEAMNPPPVTPIEALLEQPTPEAPAPVEPPAPPAPAPAPTVDYEHKFKTLQGMIESQNRRHAQEKQEVATKLQEAQERIKQLIANPPKPPEKPAASKEDVDRFGDDMVAMVQRVAEQMLTQFVQTARTQIADHETRLAQLEQVVPGMTQKVQLSAEQVFFHQLGVLVPDWQTVNNADAFKAWCVKPDPVHRVPPQAALDAAVASHDADGAAAVFKAYQQQSAATKPSAPAPAPSIAPPASAPAAPAVNQARAVVRVQEVEAFYNDVARGRYRGREAEYAAKEAAINLALAEGRVR